MADLMCFDLHGGLGKAAIYTVPDTNVADDAPLSNPLDHLSRLKFHTDLDYLTILSTVTGSLSLPSRPAGGTGLYNGFTHTIGAHGRPGNPLVEGFITVAGVQIALAGNVPVQTSPGLVRWLALGADATNILVHEYYCIARNSTLPALTVPYTVFITSEIL